ncbi:RNA-binding KH domain-containing protein [Arabidopsis thaliana]|jgi:poly(rC)-binding protein 2/3/4|nr:RNA-binding KH domain-containing protein [Arabidopsis thaliana]ANM68831.1 RNA-binding KH domain-containing protein [Arabidopsis thaliana]|eukprot:NP_001330551.1 RNA-binding KH domain-containing protein [Arabidopsis thaliana]
MERSRSKRNYHYDQDYDGDSMPRSKPRYNNNYHFGGGGGGNNRYRGGGGGGGGNGRPSKSHPETMATTTYRILCHDAKAGGVIGKSGTIIKSIRQHTGAWINVHELVPGDAERIIEISDNRRRDPDGRMPSFSPAQEALFSVHDRILESEAQFGYGGPPPEEEEDYGGVRPGGGRVVTRLVVSRMHVGCLLGKGGKIIEQMRIETKTHIRILPRESNLPRCVSLSEEIVQIVGELNAVKNALAIVSSRLRESQHRDRSNFQGRSHSPERSFAAAGDDYMPQLRRQSSDRFPRGNFRNNNFSSRQSNYAEEAPAVPVGENVYSEELVFQILCPADKIVRVVGESQGIIDLLQNEIGVDVRVSDPVAGSDEQIITISSEEAPDDPFFPAQEALLHIQTQIIDLIPDKDNLITTRLLVPSRDSICLEGKAGSVSEISRLTGTSVQILAREEIPRCASINDVVIQITGEIRAAREALVELTLLLRSHMFKELSQKETPPASTSTTGPLEGVAGVMEVASSNNTIQSREGPTSSNLNLQQVSTILPQFKEGFGSVAKAGESEHREEVPVTTSR